jgi:zinc protease
VLFARKHPYGYDDLGTSESVKSIGRDDLIALHHASFTPDNAALIIVGNVDAAEIDALSRRYFGSWSGTAQTRAQAIAAPPATGEVIAKDIGPATQTAIRIGRLGAKRADPDALAIRMMNVVFGEVYASRLTSNLRVKNGYTYMVRSRFSFGQDDGPFVIGTGVRSDATQAAIGEIFSEMNRMRKEPVTGAEITFARKYVENALFEQFETSSSTAMTIGDLFTYGLPGDFYRNQLRRIPTITAADITAAARRYLTPEKMIVVAVGDPRYIATR